eukprot:GEMP01068427.1.p1 GENE.GEMP01068427.1~~GEMP01068427.1.p1  ORF type:complete len:127 (+),score=15.92 GEMP01068427.1:64-444(+)
MGAAESKPVEPVPLRSAGDILNIHDLKNTHETIVTAPSRAGKPVRYTICRCWLSKKFPICDNAHQLLQKQGLQVGPVMIEIRRGPKLANVAASAARASPSMKLGSFAVMSAVGGAAGFAGAWPFPF